MTGYYAPTGGLPPQTALMTGRAVFTLGYAFIPKGTVTAVDARWRGWVNGKDLIVLRTQWLKGCTVRKAVR